MGFSHTSSELPFFAIQKLIKLWVIFLWVTFLFFSNHIQDCRDAVVPCVAELMSSTVWAKQQPSSNRQQGHSCVLSWLSDSTHQRITSFPLRLEFNSLPRNGTCCTPVTFIILSCASCPRLWGLLLSPCPPSFFPVGLLEMWVPRVLAPKSSIYVTRMPWSASSCLDDILQWHTTEMSGQKKLKDECYKGVKILFQRKPLVAIYPSHSVPILTKPQISIFLNSHLTLLQGQTSLHIFQHKPLLSASS